PSAAAQNVQQPPRAQQEPTQRATPPGTNRQPVGGQAGAAPASGVPQAQAAPAPQATASSSGSPPNPADQPPSNPAAKPPSPSGAGNGTANLSFNPGRITPAQ